MFSRHKEELTEWVNTKDAEVQMAWRTKYDEEQQAKQKELDEAEQKLRAKLGGTVLEWERRQREDEEYLKKEGGLQVFRDAQKLLSKGYRFLDTSKRSHVCILKPKKEDQVVNTFVELIWDIGSFYAGSNYTSKQVRCFVAREEGTPVGFRLNELPELLPNKFFLGRRLIEVIKETPSIILTRESLSQLHGGNSV
ncbi:MAG: hypothetical protein Q7R49_04015 [Candidatus Daviesbacteria bacterium]|nr:hypothetical protein [Candidatus Daviesbacteria bacterium]